MKRLISAVAVILGMAQAGWGAPAPLTTLREIHALTNAQASQKLPVAFEATVTYFRNYENTLFVQDGDTAIYVYAPSNLKLSPGDRVLVRGETQRELQSLYHQQRASHYCATARCQSRNRQPSIR